MLNVEPERNFTYRYFAPPLSPKLFCQSSRIPLIICPVIHYPHKQLNGKHIYPIYN